MTTNPKSDGPGASTVPATLRVGLVEDQREMRETLVALIDREDGFECCGSFGTMEQALQGFEAERPHIALIDLGLPGMSGVEGIGLLRNRDPELLMLVLTVFDDDRRIFDALCAGAHGYLLKNTPPDRILTSLREAAEGGAPMSPEIARRVVTLFREVRPPETADYALTPHEKRILGMLVDGHNYKTAAAELGVSVNTIGFHAKSIYSKLEVHSRSEAVAKALRSGIVS